MSKFFVTLFVTLSIVGTILTSPISYAQVLRLNYSEERISVTSNGATLYGTLTLPASGNIQQPIPIALFIAGSGPTDRNGNSAMGLSSNAYLLLCNALANSGIASLRYDKFGVGESKPAVNNTVPEERRRFTAEVDDAVAWLHLLKQDKRFSRLHIIGHSQGSLVAILAAQQLNKNLTSLISLAGLGNKGSVTLRTQLAAQPPMVSASANPIIDSLERGIKVSNVPPFLNTLFHPSLQSYLISWFQYDPAMELGKLPIPSLIVQGTNDIQVSIDEAKRLATANSQTKLQLVENMNHIFRIIKSSDRNENLASYNIPTLPISTDLIESIRTFILKNP